MKIVVTGAHGQLGGELCRQLGSEAVGVDIDTLDLTDGPAVLERIARIEPDAVINCAAYTQVDRAEEQPELCRAVNATAVAHLVAACRRADCPLLQISTDYVFAGYTDRNTPLGENAPPLPRGVYAETKLEGERAAARYEEHWIVRTCGLYARPSDPQANNFVKTILAASQTRDELRVVDDQRCTPSYVPHVAAAVMFLARSVGSAAAPWGIYHVTNRGDTTWYDLTCELLRRANIATTVRTITTAEYGLPAPRPAYSVLDTTAYHRLGGPPMPDWQAALAEYLAEWKGLGDRG